jgi:hypothetical protein
MVWDPTEEDAREALEPVYYDVPPHLKTELWEWTSSHLYQPIQGHGSNPFAVVMSALRIPDPPTSVSYAHAMLEQESQDPAFQLRVIRALLKHRRNESRAGELERRLKRGNSGYAVNAALDGLEFRVPPAARDEIEHATAVTPETVSQLLTKAWNAAYGVDARPDDAFLSAYKAAEAALRPVITPNDANTSLNKLISIYEAKSSKWELVVKESRATFDPSKHTELNGAETVMQMARTISYGQKARHGQDADVNSFQEARVAVHLAITIAMAVHEGAFRAVTQP